MAEKRAEIWLEQVAIFNDYFTEKYEKQCRKLDKYPFKSVLCTIKTWLPFILNYIDYKDRYDIKVTNAFAEYANKQIRQAYKKGNGYSFEVLRIKLIYGDFIKEALPDHPIKAKRKASDIKNTEPETLESSNNEQDSNVVVLRKVREDKNELKGLIPNPMEVDSWKDRFEAYVTSPDSEESQSEDKSVPGLEKPDLQPNTVLPKKRKRQDSKSNDINPNQPSLF